MDDEQILARVREAILKVLGDYIAYENPDAARTIIEEATYAKGQDPGGWAPEAEATIHCESGIPSGDYDTEILELWFRVSDELTDLGLFCELQNSAVIAVWPV